MNTAACPHVRISGAPHERGVQLGRQAADRVRNSIALYTDLLAHYTGMGWSDVRRLALQYEPAIEAYDGEMLPEMAGIAEGAGVDLEDILAINTRTEIMYGHQPQVLPECTAFGAQGAATTDGRVLLGQNWDWLPRAAGSCIVLQAELPGRPSFVTFVEAGLLAKMGCNDRGIGMVTNLLVSGEDQGTPGVPFHAVLRRILTSPTFDEAVAAVTDADRASSGNYLISGQGEMIDLEARPGGVRAIEPTDDLLVHANSFCEAIPHADRGSESLPDSWPRTNRMDRLIRDEHGRIDLESAGELLEDHDGEPTSICRHLPDAPHPMKDLATVGSVLIEPATARMHLAFGHPCESARTTIEMSVTA